MNLEKIIQAVDLKVLTEPKDFSAIDVNSGYCSDPGGIWITLMAHGNM
jgi:hypothetical protein